MFGATRDVFSQAAKDAWGTTKTFSAAAGFPVTVLEATLSHRGFDVRPINSEVIDEQQRIADTFKEIRLVPVTIKVSNAVHKIGVVIRSTIPLLFGCSHAAPHECGRPKWVNRYRATTD